MKITAVEKTTLLDYPGKVASTIFTYGCNFKCPFCHNPELVIPDYENIDEISKEMVLKFLNSRKKKLDGVVITGGEPMIHDDLFDFVREIRKLRLLVKIDTNGTFPDKIALFNKSNLVDYWAMDIKNSAEKYSETAGVPIGIEAIQSSISLIKNSGVEYEFRTTFVPGLHDETSAHGIGELINGAKKFFIQNFRSGKTLDPDFEKKGSFTDNELERFKRILGEYVERVEIRN